MDKYYFNKLLIEDQEKIQFYKKYEKELYLYYPVVLICKEYQQFYSLQMNGEFLNLYYFCIDFFILYKILRQDFNIIDEKRYTHFGTHQKDLYDIDFSEEIVSFRFFCPEEVFIEYQILHDILSDILALWDKRHFGEEMSQEEYFQFFLEQLYYYTSNPEEIISRNRNGEKNTPIDEENVPVDKKRGFGISAKDFLGLYLQCQLGCEVVNIAIFLEEREI